MARNESIFSRLVCWRTTMTQCRPYSTAIIASPIAVLPEEASTTVPPGASRPSASAFSIM